MRFKKILKELLIELFKKPFKKLQLQLLVYRMLHAKSRYELFELAEKLGRFGLLRGDDVIVWRGCGILTKSYDRSQGGGESDFRILYGRVKMRMLCDDIYKYGYYIAYEVCPEPFAVVYYKIKDSSIGCKDDPWTWCGEQHFMTAVLVKPKNGKTEPYPWSWHLYPCPNKDP